LTGAQTPGGFLHEPDRRPCLSLSAEERCEKWEGLYAQPGFGIWLSNFLEIFVDRAFNEAVLLDLQQAPTTAGWALLEMP